VKIFRRKLFWFVVILVLIFWSFKFAKNYPSHIDLKAKDNFWGLTYSPKFAQSLGLNTDELYVAILDDLQAKNIRLPIYWDDIEKSQGQFDFAQYDKLLDEGAKRDVKFVANIGWRLPRWPECHQPAWVKPSDLSATHEQILGMMTQTINRYKGRPEIVAWQVENEPLLDWFGQCPNGDLEFLKKEVALVKSLDNTRPIIISASGELSTWRNETKVGDIFATTVYRVVWNNWFSYTRYPVPAWFYHLKLYLNGSRRDQAIISELQTEPWVPYGSLKDLSYKEYNQSLNMEQFKANLQFAINVDFNQAYLWGVEWWYWQKQQGHPEYWNLVKNLMAGNFDK